MTGRPGDPPPSAPDASWAKGTVHDAWATPYLRAEDADFFTPSRQEKPQRWIVVHRPAAVAIAPVTPDGGFVLIRQERIPARQVFWEFPAGQIDHDGFRDLDPDSAPARAILEETARRELREETGYELAPGGELIPMGRFFTSPGFTDELVYLFLARPVTPHEHGTQHDDGEAITSVETLTPDKLRAHVASGLTQDANSLALFARLSARGLVAPSPPATLR